MKEAVKFVDTLRLSEPERKALLAKLQDDDEGATGELRADLRVPYDVAAGVILTLHQLGGTINHFLVRPRNISRGGIGFLHGQFIHGGCRCEMSLRTVNGGAAMLKGHIAWCRHITGRVHEIGVHFDSTVTLSTFVESCLRTEADQQESLKLANMRGRLLYVDDSEAHRDLLKFHLSTLGVEVETANDAMTAMEMLESRKFDAILTEYLLPGINGAELIELMQASGAKQPILVLTGDASETVKADCIAKGAQSVLTKPFSLEQLLAVLTPHIGQPEAAAIDACYSDYWTKTSMRPLILKFLPKLEESVNRLVSMAQNEPDPALLSKLCLDIRGSSGGYGFPSVMRAADAVYQAISSQATPADMQRALNHLKTAATAACHIPELKAAG